MISLGLPVTTLFNVIYINESMTKRARNLMTANILLLLEKRVAVSRIWSMLSVYRLTVHTHVILILRRFCGKAMIGITGDAFERK